MALTGHFIIIIYSNSKWQSEWCWLHECTIRKNEKLKCFELSGINMDF